MKSDFDYTVTSHKDFDSATRSVAEEIAKAGMQVLHVHDVRETLAAKGFAREPFKIIEFCNAQYASRFLEADTRLGLCMPCKINVYLKDGTTYLSGMRPIVLPEFFPDVDLGTMPSEIDQKVRAIIDNAK